MTRLSANEFLMLRAAGPQAVQLIALETAFDTGRRMRAESLRSSVAGLGKGLGRMGRSVVAGVTRARTRRRVIEQLGRLDNRLLRDIGLERGNLVEAVDASLERRAPSWAIESLADIGKALVRPLARWHRNAVTLGELKQLDDHLLADIGVTRGDLRYAPDVVLARAYAAEAANRNQASRHAA